MTVQCNNKTSCRSAVCGFLWVLLILYSCDRELNTQQQWCALVSTDLWGAEFWKHRAITRWVDLQPKPASNQVFQVFRVDYLLFILQCLVRCHVSGATVCVCGWFSFIVTVMTFGVTINRSRVNNKYTINKYRYCSKSGGCLCWSYTV